MHKYFYILRTPSPNVKGKGPRRLLSDARDKREKLRARRQKSHAARPRLVDYFAVWESTREAG